MKFYMKIIVFILSIGVSGFLLYLYAMYIGAKGFRVKEYKIEDKDISINYDGLKVAHLSDIHYGFGITKRDLEKIVNDVNKLKPDIIVFTGDLVNNDISIKQYKELVEVLSKLEASIGKYAIDGNHDYAYKKFDALIEESGFKNLKDSYEIIQANGNDKIFLAGVSNNTFTTKKIEHKSEVIFDYMNSKEFGSSYNILIMHEPDYVTDVDYSLFDLILAGHSHDGQVKFPFIGSIYTPIGSKKYHKNYYLLDNTHFYISSGIGTSELPIRFLNKPSYNFYRIIKK